MLDGKVCFAVCPSDTAIALAALGAEIKIGRPAGERTIKVKEFFTPLGNVLKADEMVKEIQIPKPECKATQTFFKFRLRKPVDFAMVSVASVITLEGGICKDARIILGAVAHKPISATRVEQAIKGEIIDATTAERAAEAAVLGATPPSMNAYKVEITKTLVKKAILS